MVVGHGTSRIAWAFASWALDRLAWALIYPAAALTLAANRLHIAAGHANRKAFP